MKTENSVRGGPERVGGNGRAGRCIHCHGKVKAGGDRHAKTKCSVRGIFGDHRKNAKHKLRNKKQMITNTKRNTPVAGVHKRNASSKVK